MGCFLIPIPFYLLFSKSILKFVFPTLVFYFIPKLWYMPSCTPLFLMIALWHNAKKNIFSLLQTSTRSRGFLLLVEKCYFWALTIKSSCMSWSVQKNAPSIFVGILRVFTKKKKKRKKEKQKECQGSRLWDQGITLLIKIQVALLPMGIQCNTLDWIR